MSETRPEPVRGLVSTRAAALTTSRLAHLMRVARERNAIDLSLGVPEYPEPPQEAIDKACDALRSGSNQYGDPYGDAGLRAALAETLTTPADPETEITVTTGASEALCLALICTVDPGDEVIVLEPYYEHFINAIAFAGARPRFVPLHPPQWRYDPKELAAAFGPRTRAVLLNTPHNPTGRVFDLEELREIADLCDRWNVTVICDEVYSSAVFDGRMHLSVADLPQLRFRSIVLGSLSKSHALSGWRVGFLMAEAARTTVLRRALMVTTAGGAAPLQAAVAAAGLLHRGSDADPAAILEQRRDQALLALRRAGLPTRSVEGGCYLLADVRTATDEGSDAFVRRMLYEAGVLLAPGALFTSDPAWGRQFVRVAFNRRRETLQKAERNLTAVLTGRKGDRTGRGDNVRQLRAPA